MFVLILCKYVNNYYHLTLAVLRNENVKTKFNFDIFDSKTARLFALIPQKVKTILSSPLLC